MGSDANVTPMPAPPREPLVGELEARRIQGALRAKLFGDPVLAPVVGGFAVGTVIGTRCGVRCYVGTRPQASKTVRLWIVQARDCPPALIDAMTARAARLPALGVVAAGLDGDSVFVATEAGDTLVPPPAPQPWHACSPVWRSVARALAEIHRLGEVHGAFSPSDVLERAGAPQLDMGWSLLCRAVDTARRERMRAHGRPYAPPSPALAADAATDVYAFCASLWEALSGRVPFGGATWEEIDEDKRRGAPRLPRSTRVPPAVARLLQRGLDPQPHRRPPDMQAVVDALSSMSSRRWWLAAVPLAGLVGAAAALTLAPQRTHACEMLDDSAPGSRGAPSKEDGSTSDGEAEFWVARHTAATAPLRDACTTAPADVSPARVAACLEALRNERVVAAELSSRHPARPEQRAEVGTHVDALLDPAACREPEPSWAGAHSLYLQLSLGRFSPEAERELTALPPTSAALLQLRAALWPGPSSATGRSAGIAELSAALDRAQALRSTTLEVRAMEALAIREAQAGRDQRAAQWLRNAEAAASNGPPALRERIVSTRAAIVDRSAVPSEASDASSATTRVP